MINVTVPENTTDVGLRIYHPGIVIHPNAHCGANLSLHGSNCIGSNAKDQLAPTIGEGVDLGVGSVVIGDVVIAGHIKVGAGAVVTKSFLEEGCILKGVPAAVAIHGSSLKQGDYE